jgi:hypothetical protein
MHHLLGPAHFKTRLQSAKSPSRLACGHGYSLMQLNWVAEAWKLDSAGDLGKLTGTVLEELASRRVQWLVSHTIADLALMTRTSWVDLVMLPFLMSAHKASGINGLTQVRRGGPPTGKRFVVAKRCAGSVGYPHGKILSISYAPTDVLSVWM